MSDTELLSLGNFHDAYKEGPNHAKAMICRVLDCALRDFRNNKIEPYLSNLQHMLAFSSAFPSLNLSGFERATRGLKFDAEAMNSMLQWVEKHQHSDKFTAVKEVVSWTYPYMVEVIQEGLPIRQLVLENSKLLRVKEGQVEDAKGVVIIGHWATGRAYGFQYTVCDEKIRLGPELKPNFPLLEETDSDHLNPMPQDSVSFSDLWRGHPDVNNFERFKSKVGSKLEGYDSTFYFCSEFNHLPFRETLIPVAVRKLQSQLQGALGQRSLF
jgi:hypothetical protein